MSKDTAIVVTTETRDKIGKLAKEEYRSLKAMLECIVDFYIKNK